MKKLLFILLLAVMMVSCTDNARARHWGGTEVITLQKGEEFMNATWKETSLWIIVKDSATGNIIIREKSSFGVWEGKIIIKK